MAVKIPSRPPLSSSARPCELRNQRPDRHLDGWAMIDEPYFAEYLIPTELLDPEGAFFVEASGCAPFAGVARHLVYVRDGRPCQYGVVAINGVGTTRFAPVRRQLRMSTISSSLPIWILRHPHQTFPSSARNNSFDFSRHSLKSEFRCAGHSVSTSGPCHSRIFLSTLQFAWRSSR